MSAAVIDGGEDMRLLHDRLNRRIVPDHRLGGGSDREEFSSRLDALD